MNILVDTLINYFKVILVSVLASFAPVALYLYSNGSLMLNDYLMQDMIEIYTYENENNLTLSENHKMLSDKILFETTNITKGGILEYYFALKFSDDATIEYAFQNLLIKALFVGLED